MIRFYKYFGNMTEQELEQSIVKFVQENSRLPSRLLKLLNETSQEVL